MQNSNSVSELLQSASLVEISAQGQAVHEDADPLTNTRIGRVHAPIGLHGGPAEDDLSGGSLSIGGER